MMNLSTAHIKDKNFRKLSQKVVAEMKRLSIPGVAIGVWHKGREFSDGFGITSIENPLPVTSDTLFQVGSISKTFTGTLIMQLAEQGKVNLDAPVRTYLKDLKLSDKAVEKQVTVRHLLTHTGGWVGDYFNDFGNGDDALARMVKDIAHLPQVMPLGEIWSYNNTGFNIASRLIEVLTGKPYEQAAQEMLLDPLGLKMSFFFPSDLLITHRFVTGHYNENKKTFVSRPWAIGRAGNGVGGVVSTVKDLLAYARFHMGNGSRIIKRKSLEAMRIPQISAGGRGEMGITWFINRSGSLTRYSHGGATNGQQALFVFIPEKDFALALLTNNDNGGVLNNNLLGLALEVYFGIKPKLPKPIKVSTNELKEYVGSYRIGTEAFDLKLKNGELIFQHIPLGGFPTPDSPPGPAMPPMRVAFYEKDQTLMLDEPMKNGIGDFIRDKNGRVQFFRIGGRAHKKIK
ncbi:MAG TPA: serine hydrolase domain-containing protein [Anaerolineales bacterium]|nr:serine hydrolase domain-containing protein [Anaerolineales bacterium]HND90238.1 serine hydrolase domain-containing protein [Anaerolineales bacterium]HNH77452.1 serine hydrolase domain-containing protein [Anaerolineales bacterium]